MSHDTILHRLVRPPVGWLTHTQISPNHLTCLRLATAAAAGLGFAVGTGPWIIAGAVAFTLSALLDRADGTLARLTGRFSRLGHRFDLMADLGADALIFLCIGIGASHGWLGWRAPVLGLVAAGATGLLFWRLNLPSRRPAPRRLADPDDMMLGVPLLACTVGLAPVVLLAGVITPLAAAVLMLGGWRRRRAEHASDPV